MAALAFALPTGTVRTAPIMNDRPVLARPRTLAFRWVRDPSTGKFVGRWFPATESRRPILHLKLVRS
jgi:hypothetical protein